MVKSLLKALKPKRKAAPVEEITPDIARALKPQSPELRGAKSAPANAADLEIVDMSRWMTKDIETLSVSWTDQTNDFSSEAATLAMKSAIHNLHGASGAYGGGALTRLTGSLQRLYGNGDGAKVDAALINLHVQACRAYLVSQGQGAEDITNAVCDALEAQVSKARGD